MLSDGKANICHKNINFLIASNEDMVTHPMVARGAALDTLFESPVLFLQIFDVPVPILIYVSL